VGIGGWSKRRTITRAEEASRLAQAESARIAEEERLEAERAEVAAGDRRAEMDRRAAEAAEAQRRALEDMYQEWLDQEAHLRSLLHTATTYEGFRSGPLVTVQLQRGERWLFGVTGAELIEPRKQRGTYVGGSRGYTIPGERPHYVGGHAGFSYRIAPKLRVGVGAARGHLVGGTPSTHIPATSATFIPGQEVLTPVDVGIATITDRRVIFQGQKRAVEWPFARLLGYDHRTTWTSLQSSNRQKVSAIGYGEAASADWEFFLALGLARFSGSADDFVAHLQTEIEVHHREGAALVSAAEEHPGTRVEPSGQPFAGTSDKGSSGVRPEEADTTPPTAVASAQGPAVTQSPPEQDGWWTEDRVSDLLARISPRARDALTFIADHAPEVAFDDALGHLGLDGRGTAAVMKSVGTALREMKAPQLLQRDYQRRIYRMSSDVAGRIAMSAE